MHSFAQKPKAPQQTTAAKSSIAGRGHLGQVTEERSKLYVQRTIGHRAAQRLLLTDGEELAAERAGTATRRFGYGFGGISIFSPAPRSTQTKLVINRPGDSYERDADRIAEHVLRTPTSPLRASTISTLSSAAGTRAREGSTPGPHVTPKVEANVRALQSEGSPLAPATREYFESRLGADFSQVRVNTGTRAQETASSLGARAFTLGQSMTFGAGQYAPETNDGKRLLAHELIHVVQQSGVRGAGAPVQRSGAIVQRDPLPQRAPPQPTPMQTAPPQAKPAQAAPKIKFQFGILVQEDVETNVQVAAIARLMIITLKEGLADVRSDTVKTKVNDWIRTVEGALPFFDRHAGEKVDPVIIPLINHQFDELLEIQDAVRQDKVLQIKEALWREHDAAIKAAEEAEALQPALDDAMRAAYRKGSSGTLKEVVSMVKSSINIGRNIRTLAAGITTEIMGLPLASGTKVYVDHWTSRIGRPKITIVNIDKYTKSLNKLGRGLSALNAVLTAADRSKKATAAEQGMKDLSDAFNIGTDLISASPWGAPPHFALYSSLYLKPALKVISVQIGMLVENLSDINRTSVGVTGMLMYPNVEPGGQEMFDLMVEVMHAESQSDIPSLPNGVQKYLFDHREKLGIGTESGVPTVGSLWWKSLDAGAGRRWLFTNRKRVWAMFYGSMKVPAGKR